LKHFITS